jgi:hypothetical protein
MAFEIPLEADRIDDLNLFSTFVRAPVIGTLFWLLGGHNQSKDDESSNPRLDDNDGEALIDDNSHTDIDSSTMKRSLSKAQRCTLKKAAPSLIGSEISESEVRESLDAMCLHQEISYKHIPGMEKKSLSWSDELVIYPEVVRPNTRIAQVVSPP